MIKTIITSGFTALVVALVVTMLVGSNSPAVGGETRFPNSDMTVQTITTTGEVQRFGSRSVRNIMYIGAGDGCAAVYYNASSTQTVQATSTSFCGN